MIWIPDDININGNTKENDLAFRRNERIGIDNVLNQLIKRPSSVVENSCRESIKASVISTRFRNI